MALLNGIDRDAPGAVAQTATGTIVYQSGMPLTSLGELRTTTITGAPPGGSTVNQGLSLAADGSIHVTADAIGIVQAGVAYTALGVLCITTNAPDNNSKTAYVPQIGMVRVDATGRVHVS
jgi:hypothetical protein